MEYIIGDVSVIEKNIINIKIATTGFLSLVATKENGIMENYKIINLKHVKNVNTMGCHGISVHIVKTKCIQHDVIGDIHIFLIIPDDGEFRMLVSRKDGTLRMYRDAAKQEQHSLDK